MEQFRYVGRQKCGWIICARKRRVSRGPDASLGQVFASVPSNQELVKIDEVEKNPEGLQPDRL